MTLKQSNAVVVVDLSHVEEIPAKTSKWQVVRAANHSNNTRGELKLNNVIKDLQKFTLNAEEKAKNQSRTFRQRLAHFLQNTKFHYLIISLVIADLIIVLIDLIIGMLTRFNGVIRKAIGQLPNISEIIDQY